MELLSTGDAEDEDDDDDDSTMPMKELPILAGLAGAAAAAGGVAAATAGVDVGAGVVLVLVVVVRGFTVERTEVSTVVRNIFDVESVVCEICVRGVASQLAVLLQKMIRLF